MTLQAQDVDVHRPLIYMWEIRDASGALTGRYVGKASAGAERPLKQYSRNVANILNGKPYRKQKPDGYRKVHQALAQAQRLGHTVQLIFLCNVSPGEDIDEVERHWIREKECQGNATWQLNG